MKADEVVERIHALRELTRTTGVITKRSQNNLLASLDDATLTEVAMKLRTNERTDSVNATHHTR